MPTNPSIDLLSNRQPSIYYVEIGVAIIPCSGSPNNVIAANRGSLALDITTGNAYLKTTNTVATGWVIVGSGGAGNPSPPNFSVQFNSGGVFLGDAEFLYNPTTNTLTLTGILNVTTVNATDVNTTNLSATNATITNLSFTNPPVLTGYTPGSVLFVGASSEIDEDTANFFYSTLTKQLSVIGIVQSNASFVSGIPNSISGELVLFASGNGNQTTIRSGDTPDANVIVKIPVNNNTASPGDSLTVLSNAAGILQTEWNTVTGGGGAFGPVVAKTGNYTILSGDNGKVITNEGAAGQVDLTLDNLAVDFVITILVKAAFTLKVIADTGETIRIVTDISATAGFADSATVGSSITLVKTNATDWDAVISQGVWSVT